MNFIYPSVLSADFSILKEQIRELENSNIKSIHIDIMDGKFVPNISFGFPILKCIREITNLNLDVHLMIDEPIRYIDEFVKYGADLITVHIEGNHHIHRIIQEIKKHNVKAGIAINPGTPIESLKEILPLVDLVLVMGVNPGFGGQAFIENTLNRIKELSVIKKEKSFNFDINVDGGIKSSNYMRVLECGANNIIIGSDLFKDNDITNNISKFR
ncbi:ribulose-phosphate 3-epimerase [Clostridium sp. D53t1_180928_C8]|uniref:ribulose-phosphate 3-epimerase n=1 Tax=Clostridium sp. D53t1_180928_C8 TaxID=2787101 RepID=UPI0018A8C62F|nr:ribulose-phosphate 3-epimerase [Clostridium sp. D53t1_180928_C8]